MKRSMLLAAALLGLALLATGCATFRRPAARSHTPTYALVVSVNGGQAPTDAQWAALQKRFATALAARGAVLITDASLADNIIHVQFFPDLTDPTLGTAYVVGVQPNTLAFAASPSSMLPWNYGYSSYTYPGAFYSDDYADYYGYYPSSGGGYVTKPYTPPPTPPNGKDPDHRRRPGDNPPDNQKNRTPPGYAGGGRPWHPNPGDGDRPPRHRPEPTSVSPGYSSGASYSSSGFVGPTTSYSSSSSYSAPSISMPSSDSSFSSSSSSSFSAPSSSPSSDSGSSGGGSVTEQKNN